MPEDGNKSPTIHDNIARVTAIIALLGTIAGGGYYYRSMTAQDEILETKIAAVEKLVDKEALKEIKKRAEESQKVIGDDLKKAVEELNRVAALRADELSKIKPPLIVGVEVLPLRWVSRGELIRLFEQQVVLRIEMIYRGFKEVDITVSVPNTPEKMIEVKGDGNHDLFEYDGHAFMVFVNGFRDKNEKGENVDQVELSLVRKLTPTSQKDAKAEAK